MVGVLRIRRLAPVLVLGILFACEDDTLEPIPSTPDSGMAPTRCESDADCPDRHGCMVLTGICFPRDACGPDRPCPDPMQVCEDSNGDGYLDCVFERCAEDADCSDLMCPPPQVARCSAGGCICGDPCQGGCPSGQGCCVPEDRCHPLPPRCMGLACSPGEFLSITSTGAWDTGMCQLTGETCECEALPPLELGDVGLYSAIAYDRETPLVSAYNLTWGDLTLGRLQPDGITMDWEFVDGVGTSTTMITGGIDGPRRGNSDIGDDVGIYTDIAVDRRGRPHIAYMDRTNGALKYAVGDPAGWKIHTIESGGSTGMFASMTISREGLRVVAYLAARQPNGSTRFNVLRLAISSTLTPTRDSDWQIRTIESQSLAAYGCEEQCNPGEVCRASDLQCHTPDPSGCPSGCGAGERCIANRCSLIDPLPPFRTLPLARGLWPSVQMLPDRTILVAYHDRIERNLKVARIAGPNPSTGAISVQTVDGRGAGTMDDVGHYPSLFVTPGGEIHLAYMNATRRSVQYRNLGAGLTTVVNERVESGLGSATVPGGDLVGADPAVVVDASGTVRIAYQNATTGELRYARRMGTDSWTIVTLKGKEMPYSGSYGFYTDQAVDSMRGAPMVSTYRYWLLEDGNNNGLELITPP